MRTLALCLLVASLTVACENNLIYYGADGMPRKSPDPRDFFTANPDVPPEMAGSRRINEVDCSKPVDLSQGNLRCK